MYTGEQKVHQKGSAHRHHLRPQSLPKRSVFQASGWPSRRRSYFWRTIVPLATQCDLSRCLRRGGGVWLYAVLGWTKPNRIIVRFSSMTSRVHASQTVRGERARKISVTGNADTSPWSRYPGELDDPDSQPAPLRHPFNPSPTPVRWVTPIVVPLPPHPQEPL